MKKYNITENGKSYEVEVQELGGSTAPVYAAPAPTPAPVAAPAPVSAAPAAAAAAAPKAAAPAAAPSEGANVVTAPIPGKILDVKVAVGDAVKQGELLLILEAMKMENEIFSAYTGTVDTIQVAKGDSVNAGDVLLSLK